MDAIITYVVKGLAVDERNRPLAEAPFYASMTVEGALIFIETVQAISSSVPKSYEGALFTTDGTAASKAGG